MKHLHLTMALVIGTGSAILAAETLRRFSWPAAPPAPAGFEMAVLPQGGKTFAVLQVLKTSTTPGAATILTVDAPPVTGYRYALRGRIKYEDVEGQAYLEMLNHFEGHGTFSTRTLASAGILRSLKGSSSWRAFVLPFDSSQARKTPDRLMLNVVMPGRGRVWIETPELVQFAPGDDPSRAPGQWWGDRQAGLFGGLAGALLGLCGGLIGPLAGHGKARRFVIGLMSVITALGVLAFTAGVVAVLQHQPYAVVFPLLLVGGLATSICGGLIPVVRRRYAEIELRKLQAADAQ